MTAQAFVELRELALNTQIGTYGPMDTPPDTHLLDLTLGIGSHRVLIAKDEMANVFDYDPLMAEIDRLAEDGHYETQERLMTRIAQACVAYPDILCIDIRLRKAPVSRPPYRAGSPRRRRHARAGSLGQSPSARQGPRQSSG